ncbi:SDR family NAD(P)-dependent oxidoreductase [Brevundimonas sp. CEF1]|uniref:SDR family NAD(P)-dependent oxidoreductase n=1 Tax=Brevundimonas sp. CEF1 TaxID=3442642 RepID=UPI003F51A1A7
MTLNRTAIVTGGGTGLGRAIALRLAEDGYNVVLNGRIQSNLDEVAALIGPERSLVVVADVSVRADADRIITEAVAKFGQIDVVVNNAGVVNPGTADTLREDDFNRMMAVNVGGVRNVSLAALPELRKSRGNIVNMSSVSGMRGDWGMYGYNASKGAVSLMTQGMALDLGIEGVRVNAVAPAAANTRLAAPMAGNAKAAEAFAARIPMGRLVEPEEVAHAVAFLADNTRAGFINGVILPIDGGLSASNGQPSFVALAAG